MHVYKSSVNHALLQGISHADILLEAHGCVVAENLPALNVLGLLEGAVVALAQGNGFLELGPAAGLQMCVGLLDQLVPVCDAAAHGAAVDEVKGLVGAVHPLRLGVVDVELCVWRDPCWLDGGEIGTQDFSAGVLVGKVYGPYPRAGADVEHSGGRGLDGGVVELAAEDEQEDVVQQVEAVLLLLVVGQDVGARAEAMVAAAVAVLVVQYGRGERGRCRRVCVKGAVVVAVAARVGLEVQDRLQIARVCLVVGVVGGGRWWRFCRRRRRRALGWTGFRRWLRVRRRRQRAASGGSRHGV